MKSCQNVLTSDAIIFVLSEDGIDRVTHSKHMHPIKDKSLMKSYDNMPNFISRSSQFQLPSKLSI